MVCCSWSPLFTPSLPTVISLPVFSWKNGFLVLNYWLHGYHTPKGVGSQLSFGAGLGSRCWVDTEQPRPSSPDISPCARLSLEKDSLVHHCKESSSSCPPFSEDPSDSDAHVPVKDTARTAGEALLLIPWSLCVLVWY
ncbi:hypothetical protein APTSU1_001115200 [Apodemus speciosus]|uniref:Uncharacterized protein n=1 Tax=Apodemus speciosus TaxID=105296 RepID=A0ABQ0F9H1_APOSI